MVTDTCFKAPHGLSATRFIGVNPCSSVVSAPSDGHSFVSNRVHSWLRFDQMSGLRCRPAGEGETVDLGVVTHVDGK